MKFFLSVLVLCAAAAVCGDVHAGQYNPTGPVIYFDSFERPQLDYWTNGTVDNTKGSRPNTSSMKLVKSGKKMQAIFNISSIGLKLTGANLANVYVGFKLYTNDQCKQVVIDFAGYSHTVAISKHGDWVPIEVELSKLVAKGKKPPPDTVLSTMSIAIAEKDNKGVPEAHLDDFIITVNVTPEAAWPSAAANEAVKQKRSARMEQNGYQYDDTMESKMEAALRKAAVKTEARAVMVATSAKYRPLLLKALADESEKRPFYSPELPKDASLNNLTDAKLLLPYSLSKKKCEFVLIMPTPQDAMRANAEKDAISVARRCLAMGAMPVFVLPSVPPGTDPKQVDAANAKLIKELYALGVVCINPSFTAKAAKDYDGNTLSADGLKGLCKVIEQAVATLEKHVRN